MGRALIIAPRRGQIALHKHNEDRYDGGMTLTTTETGVASQEAALIARIKLLGDGTYLDVRALEDGTIVGIGRMLFTTAIYLDMNEWGWAQRFCFNDPASPCRNTRSPKPWMTSPPAGSLGARSGRVAASF